MAISILLNRQWNDHLAPEGWGGHAGLELYGERLELSWDLRLPEPPRFPAAVPGYTEQLWDWDVVELFLCSAQAAPGAPPRYVELEFGPAGHWIALAFQDVRRRSAELRDLAPNLVGEVAGGRWVGRADLYVPALEAHIGPRPWTGLVTAVFGGLEARLYLTWPALPGARADFHQPAAWKRLL